MSRTLSAIVLIWVTGLTPLMATEQETTQSTASPTTSAPAETAVTVAPLQHRPAALVALYGGFMALEVFDGYTTFEAKRRGAHEANPALGTGSTATVWAVKAATTASTLYFVDRLRKNHRIAATLLMAGVTSGYAAIVAHNARVAR
jgi:hypothetical protein